MASTGLLCSALLLGVLVSAASNVVSIVARSKASALPYGSGVQLSTLPAGEALSVGDSSTSLRVLFSAPDNVGGAAVSGYLVEWWDTPGSAEVVNIQMYSAGPLYGTFRLAFNGYLSDYIPYNASEAVLTSELEALYGIRAVEVLKLPAPAGFVGSIWQVTFGQDFPSSFDQQLSIDASGVVSLTSNAIVSGVFVAQPGSLPHGYQSSSVPSLPGTAVYQYVITGLVTGLPYFVRVSAVNSAGLSLAQSSVPASLAPPKQAPSEPLDGYLVSYSATSLRVLYMAPESDGGDAVISYKIEWDTSSGFNSSNGSPLGSYHNLVTPGNDCSLYHCSYVISGLTQGTPYFVRVFALNSYGYSAAAAVPVGSPMAPTTQPGPPARVMANSVGGDSVQLTIAPPADDGGSPITQYLIKWDVVGPEAYDTILTSPALSLLYFPYAVQRVRTASSAYDLSGYFSLEFGGFSTGPISVDASAETMTVALRLTPTVGDVSVVKSLDSTNHGVMWTITFLNSEWWSGGVYFDVPLLSVSNNNGSSYSSTVLSSTGGSTFQGSGASITVQSLVTAMAGYEQQLINVQTTAGALAGSFSLSLQGQSSPSIAATATDAAIMSSLALVPNFGSVLVRRRNYQTGAGESFQLLLVFLEKLGDIPAVILDSSHLYSLSPSASVSVYYETLVVGAAPLMESSFQGQLVVPSAPSPTSTTQVTIGGLEQGLAYHFRVYPWNGVGDQYGSGQGCYPAAIFPSQAPSPVTEITLAPTSDTSLVVSWTVPVEDGGTPISNYTINIATAPEQHEVQLVSIASFTSQLSGSFCLSFNGFSTGPLSYDSSASRVEAALESLPGVGNVIVTQTITSGTTYGISWRVSFLDNVGNLPLMQSSCNNLIGTNVQLLITEAVAGANPVFSTATIVNNTIIGRLSSVQIITASASSTDLNGYFFLSCSGEVSQPIDVYSSAEDMQYALESMLTIGEVTVSVEDLALDSVVPSSRYGRSWLVTFARSHYQSLLVSTDGGATADEAAFGGSVLGSNTRVDVVRSTIEGLPTSLSIPGLVSGTSYVAQVAATNEAFTSAFTTAALSANPKLSPPQPPMNVAALPLSSSALGVWWNPPLEDGGSTVTGYEVKWDVSSTFSARTNFQFVSNVTEFIILGLVPGTSYAVGVAAYSSAGYSTVVLAEMYTLPSVYDYAASSTFLIMMNSTTPSTPSSVFLTVVSRSELGVLWNAPQFDGGNALLHYLVEWDTSPYFVNAGQPFYSATVSSNGSSLSYGKFFYQITGLPQLPIYVRVSAVSINGRSDAAPAWPVGAVLCNRMPIHCSATPQNVLPYLPVSPYVQLSPQQVANRYVLERYLGLASKYYRLLVSWAQPAVDQYGFSTKSIGNHTPDIASSYVVEWSSFSDFAQTSSYNAVMIAGDYVQLDCYSSCKPVSFFRGVMHANRLSYNR